MTGPFASAFYAYRLGVARGLITADGFNAVRSLLHARTRFARRQRPYPRQGSRGRRGSWRHGVEGRWTLLPPEPIGDVEELAETVAWRTACFRRSRSRAGALWAATSTAP